MAAFERAVECLRPLVKTIAWDYCVVWRLGDDPSRFIEWLGCCCSGGNRELLNVKAKETAGKDPFLPPKCRDVNIQHPLRTEACKALANFPSSIPLYSGIHGEVVMSKQPRWLNSANSLTSDKRFGTQVLVPVAGGLIELYSRKHVPRRQEIIDFILVRCIPVEQETLAAHSFTKFVREPIYKTFLENRTNNWPATVHAPPVFKSSYHLSLEGSQMDSNISNLYLPLDSGSSQYASCNTSPEKSSGRYPGKKNSSLNLKRKQDASANQGAAEDDSLKAIQRTGRENCRSKNLVTERNRRTRIKNGIYTLRALVPNITKMDILSTLGDAIDYIQELQKTSKEYQDELREMGEEVSNEHNAEQEVPKLHWEQLGRGHQPTAQLNGNPSHSSSDDKKQPKVEIEVNQIGARNFLVKIICQQRRSGFFRLMQAMDVSGFQVTDANVTTFGGSVLNILKVEARRKEAQPKTLKDSLIKLILDDVHGSCLRQEKTSQSKHMIPGVRKHFHRNMRSSLSVSVPLLLQLKCKHNFVLTKASEDTITL